MIQISASVKVILEYDEDDNEYSFNYIVLTIGEETYELKIIGFSTIDVNLRLALETKASLKLSGTTVTYNTFKVLLNVIN